MTRKVAIRIALLVSFICAIGVTQAVASRVYGAPCGNPTGLPGLLVKMHFIAKGTCTIGAGGGCANQGSTCTITPLSGNPVSGTCQPVGNACTCVASAP